jgi:hypothetical protein
MDKITNDKIKSAVIKIKALQQEYEVTLQEYQESGENLINYLQNDNTNPCRNYTKDSTGISQKCYEKIWADQGCTNFTSVDANTDLVKAQTLDKLVNDSFLKATSTDNTSRSTCYGNTTKFTTNTNPIYPDTILFASLKGKNWWGTSGLKEGTVSTQQECEDMCSNIKQCSGATFNPVQRNCWARSGIAPITAGKDNEYALVISSKQEMLSTIRYLNQRLLDLNNQITNELRNINPELIKQYNAKASIQTQLNVSYDKLLQEKMALKQDLAENYSIEQEEYNQSLYVNKESMYFKLWILFTFIIVIITLTQIFGSNNSSTNNFVSKSSYST